MIYSEYLSLLGEKREICIFGAGFFGKGDGYAFLNSILESGQKISYFCDNNICGGVEVVDGVRTIEVEYLYTHKDDIVCIIVASARVQEEIKVQLAEHDVLNVYTLDIDDIYRLCDQIMEKGDETSKLRVEKFFKEKKYEFQIETSSFCNAKCVFCPNVSLKREKGIMKWDVFQKIINRIKDEDIKVSRFILCLNGEPLTDPDLFIRIGKLKKEFSKAKIEFTTNFALASEEVIDRLFDSGLDRIVCSLNSIDALEYKDIMGLEYGVVLNNITNLLRRKEERKSKLEICLSIVADSSNSDVVEKFKEYWGEVADVRVIKKGQWIGKETDTNCLQHSRVGVCPILYRTVNILSNGDFALCCFDAEGIVKHNIMDSSIEHAWKSEVFSSIRKWHLNNGRTNKDCINCSF